MKSIRNAAVVLILCLVLTVSCSTATKPDIQPTSFLWEVSSDVNTVYILGSVHIAKSDLYPLNEVIEDTYDLSETLVVEIDIINTSQEEAAQLLMEKGMYLPGDNLKKNISDNLYFQLSERLMEFDDSGILLNTMTLFEPWVVAITIADLDFIELGYDVEYGIDVYFLNKAESDGKDILELESAEYQLDIFDSLPDELQIMLLEDAVENPITEEELERVFDAWNTGNITTMEEIVFGGIDENPMFRSLNEKILDERNVRMVDEIEGVLEDDDIYLIVVGAGHLVGENGIINLLAKKGYKVRQL